MLKENRDVLRRFLAGGAGRPHTDDLLRALSLAVLELAAFQEGLTVYVRQSAEAAPAAPPGPR